MSKYICITCGTQYPESSAEPEHCMICEDERQYIGFGGQRWTTLELLQADHKNAIEEDEPNLIGITTEPAVAIGQRARLILAPVGNVLWESTSYIDDETIKAVNKLGGISAIGISHPHFYSSMIEWSEAFDDAPIYIHESNRQWVARQHPNIKFWSGEQYKIADGLTIIRCGGHFTGSSVLHWADGAEGRGALLTGDTINVVPDSRYVSFMYSYPNQIPLNAKAVLHIVSAVEPLDYDRIYSSWKERVILDDAKNRVHASMERYLKAISDGIE